MAKAKPTPTEEISEDLVGSELTLDTTEQAAPKAAPVVAPQVDNSHVVTPGHPSRDFHS